MFAGRFDLAFERDASGRLLPLIIAVMVYLAALALAGGLSLHGAIARWTQGLSGSLTVQVAVPEDRLADAAARETAQDTRQAAAVATLKATPGIGAVQPLSRDAVAAMLEPWLGSGADMPDLPLPRLIDVTLDAGQPLDIDALRAELETAVPGTVVDDHGIWRDRLLAIARSVRAVALLVVGLTAGAAVIAVVFATRTGLLVHRDSIEVLHLIGAHDSYVAGQFQAHAVRFGLLGGAIGIALAVLTLLGLGSVAGDLDDTLLPRLSLSVGDWVALVAVPLAAAGIAMLTARLTVLRILSRMP
jgi:cell division transport system permease protein